MSSQRQYRGGRRGRPSRLPAGRRLPAEERDEGDVAQDRGHECSEGDTRPSATTQVDEESSEPEKSNSRAEHARPEVTRKEFRRANVACVGGKVRPVVWLVRDSPHE